MTTTNGWIADSLRTETIASRYARISGFTHGFDYLRLIFACAVVVMHSFNSAYGRVGGLPIWGGWWRMLVAPILPMFFALSGFLVAGSLKKNPTVTAFMTLRAVRLVPALAVEILLSALILGPLLTSFPLADYFGGREFPRYFANLVGWVHMKLPGVFLTLPLPETVNLSLWTIPYELECYIALMALYVAGFVKHRVWLLVAVAVAVAVGTASAFHDFDAYWAINRPLPRSLIVAFLCGVALNLYADKVLLDPRLAILAVAAMAASTIIYQTIYLAVVPAAYLCVFLGMAHPPRRGLLFSGDYSYGLYLFAFPIQQTFTLLFPQYRAWYLNAAFSIVAGLLYAAFSWWVVEKPVLSRKQVVVGFAERVRDRLLTALSRRPRGHAHREDRSRIG